MRDRTLRFGSVRWRVTAAAVVVSIAGLVGAATWLVRSVEATLVTNLTEETTEAVDRVRRTMSAGEMPDQISLRMSGLMGVVVTDDTGEVVAASGLTPGAASTTWLPTGLPMITIVPDDFEPLQVAQTLPRNLVLSNRDRDFIRASSAFAVGGDTLTVSAAAPLAQVHNSLDALQNGLWVAVPLLVTGIALLAWFLTGRALQPVAAITRRVNNITHHTLDGRVPVPRSHDEVATLASTMNLMLDRLEAAAERQRAFVSDASHELRSPIAAIRTQVEVAVRHPDDTDWESVSAAVLAEESRLEQIVDDLLALARLDEERSPGGLYATDLAEIARQEATRGRRLAVVVSGPTRACVSLSPDDVRRMVSHLLDNATRHGESDVQVSISVAHDLVTMTVDDDGTGVPEDDRDRVFARFTRLDAARSRDAGGSGLGLAVVKALVVGAAGSITVATSPAGGARFAVVLPAAAEAATG